MKKKRKSIIAMVLAMIFQLSTILIPAMKVYAADTDITDKFQFITGVSITDKDGNALGDNVDKASEIHVNYTWSIPNGQTVDSGDYYTMQLPKEIKIVSPISQSISVDDGTKIADLNIGTDGSIKITFNDNVKNYSDVNGGVYVDCHFNSSEIGNSNPVPITFNLQGSAVSKTVDVNFKQPDPTITKDAAGPGYSSADDTITWQITVNKEGVNVNNAVVTDTIENTQKFVEGSVKINGTPSEDNYDAAAKKLTFNLGNIDKEQIITYKTSVHDDLAAKAQGNYNYKNTASFNYDKNGTPVNITSNTKSVPVYVKYISKDGTYNAKTKQIDWTITVNESGRTINNAVVKDTIPEGLAIDAATIKLNSNEGTEYTAGGTGYTVSGQDFTYNLGNINSLQTIKFSTSVDSAVYNSNNTKNYSNKAYLTGDGVPAGTSAGKGVGVSPSIIKKAGAGYDASKGIINWKITINNDKTNVATNAVITDTISEGQKYIPGTANIDDGTNGSFTALEDGKVVYTFNNSFSKTYTITFKTQITDDTHYRANYSGNYNNLVNITAAGIKQDTTGNQTVKSNIIQKSGKGYDYSTREITWQIVINTNKMNITNAVVTDVIPDGQEYVDGSANIDGAAQGSFNSDSDINSTGKVVYTFEPGSTINKTYTITFKTKLTDLSIFNTSGDKTIKNTASITGDEIPVSGNVSSTGTQTIKNSVITKEAGYVNGKDYIDWTVKTNANWSIPLAGAVITDTLQDGLSLNTDTVELYKAVVRADGSLTEGAKVTLTPDNVKYDPASRLFTFTFPGDSGNGAFILKFTTIAAKAGDYSNKVTFNGTTASQSGTSGSVGVWYSSGGGWGTGKTGSITVVKVDSDNNSKKLSGAVFQLLDQYGNVKATSQPTGADGAALFDKLLYDINYSVKEITAPDGYNLSSQVYTFQIKSSDVQKNITYNYLDTKIKGGIKITKTDALTSSVLPGAEIGVYDSSNNLINSGKTGMDGTIEFDNLAYGNYYFVEKNAPEGYMLNDTKYPFNITDNGVILTGSISDTKITGNILFKKIGQNGNPLKDAEFKLYKNTDTAFANAVATAVSDENGNVQFNNVDYGIYNIKETKAPAGYYLSSMVLTADINTNGATEYARPTGDTGSGLYSLTDYFIIVNIQGSVNINKADENGSSLKGAEFTLFDLNGNPVKTAVTNENGLAQFNNVQSGKYTIRETKAPEGYTISDKSVPVEVAENGKTYDAGTIKDTKIKSSIQISKTDKDGNPLPGAEFTLYDSEGNAMQNAISALDGIALFNNVTYGSYTAKETKAPLGYTIISEIIKINVNSPEMQKFVVQDEKQKDSSHEDINNKGNGSNNDKQNENNKASLENGSKLPKTGSIMDYETLLAVGVTFIIAGLKLIIKRKNTDKNI